MEGTAETPQAESITARRKKDREDSLMDNLQSLSATLVIAIFVITFLVQAFQIPSQSMENTLLIGDYLLVDKVEYSDAGWWSILLPYRKIGRGEIVVFRPPMSPDQHFVKRVIGHPGDRVRLQEGRVLVNGSPMVEGYALYKPKGRDPYRDNFPNQKYTSIYATPEWGAEYPHLIRNGELLVPEDHYFVLGDNRNESSDSRYWGLVSRESIVGKPLFIYFSFQLDPPPPVANADGRIGGFTGRLRSVWNRIRWGRSFRFVK